MGWCTRYFKENSVNTTEGEERWQHYNLSLTEANINEGSNWLKKREKEEGCWVNITLNITHWQEEEICCRSIKSRKSQRRSRLTTRPRMSVHLDTIIIMTGYRDAYLRVAVGEDQLVIDRHRFPLRQRLNQQLLFDLRGNPHRLMLTVTHTTKHEGTWKQTHLLPLTSQRAWPGPLVVPHPNPRLGL